MGSLQRHIQVPAGPAAREGGVRLRSLGVETLSLPVLSPRPSRRLAPPFRVAGPAGIVAALLVMAVLLPGCAADPGGAGAVPADEAQGAVYNAVSRVWYDDVADAFAEAGEGDALYLYDDLESGGVEAASSKLSVDLQGHALSIDAVGSGARGGQGLAHSGIAFGGGEYEVSNGSISVRVGAQPETAQSANDAYRGLLAGPGSSLTLSDVQIDVSYAGTSTIMPGVALAGVETAGSVSLQDGSSVTVESADAPGAFGASTAAGVRATGTDAGCSVAVSEDSSVAVDNRSMQVVQGAVGYPSTVLGTTKANNAELAEIAVDPSLDWYDDLCARFLANARYDDRDDPDGFVYGAEVYYASPLELENGLTVWAFSEPVGAGAAGLPENIVPAHVFARSDYALELDAYGIWCAGDFAGSVSQGGAISASTTLGHAVGVYEGSSGTYDVDSDSIRLSCGSAAYRASAGSFDLGDYIDVPADPGVQVAYPQQSTYTAVREERPAARETVVAGREEWDYLASPLAFSDLFAEWDEYGQAPASDDAQTTIGLSLTYYRMGQDGYLYTGEEAGTYAYSPDLDLIDVADERVKPGDVVEVGGVKSEFLGWSPRMSDKRPLYTEHIFLEKENWGSFGAKCALYGIYGEVQQQEAPAAGAPAVAGDPAGDVAAPVAEAGFAEGGQLPAGGLDAGASQAAEAFSPVGGMAVIGGFALVVGAGCLLWLARGRRLVAFQAEEAADGPSSWEERKREGGIRF